MAARPVSAAELGRLGEEAAAAHLVARGFEILERNWRAGPLELDLVCRDGEEIVFVEVRTRGAGSLASPAESMTRAKVSALWRAARAYLAGRGAWDVPCRFDLVSVTPSARDDDNILTVEHQSHVLDQTDALDCGDTHWQPW